MDVKPRAPPRLSVSIVLYHNPLEQLRATLASLRRAVDYARKADLVAEVGVTLVDNSCDTAYRRAVQDFLESEPEGNAWRVSYSGQSANLGFGAGHNTVLQSLDSDVHLVLNPDVELEQQALGIGLARVGQERDIALLSPRVCDDEGRQEFLCKRYPSVLVLLLRAFAPAFVQDRFRGRLDRYEMTDVCRGDQEVEVPLASGCFMLVSTGALRAVGGFNERYFMYFEDFDLSLRLRDQGRLVFEPAMRILHHGGYAARKGIRHIGYFMRSGIRFFNSHGWRWI